MSFNSTWGEKLKSLTKTKSLKTSLILLLFMLITSLIIVSLSTLYINSTNSIKQTISVTGIEEVSASVHQISASSDAIKHLVFDLSEPRRN